ncbi:sigma-70 family RNA polymerase sigma factor [Nitrosomonas sp.]|uniref:sigma-70 family RNA polymerase sigma factor n=1 Tax=Nitrosomonas sp. TaxID=42353 RepID=UPI001D78A737|nr:sigma-70 family RNA polymerase sigma factor [Nitrosomonas sp.]MBX9637853.1 sigma-70 family RNA polymerase sigma factor [Nitrosomonas sp.]MBY0483907.1 sigma-70 family RNA polymerase sigma factor [Nitrosomonas sp.]
MATSDTNCNDFNAKDAQMHLWITAIAGHDEQALAELYEATLARVYGLVLRITRSPQAAEEVSEDVYWQVWREAPRFDAQRGNVIAWLLTITRSRALDYLRKQDSAELCEEPELLLMHEPACDGDPQDLLSATQTNHQLNQALQQLEPVQRQLVALAFFRGLTHEEITALTGMALGTVKSHIRRALKQLHDALDEDLIKGFE